jgi:hypothetical protein
MIWFGVKITSQYEWLANVNKMVQYGAKLLIASVRLGNVPIKGSHSNVTEVPEAHHDTKVAVRHNAGQKPRWESVRHKYGNTRRVGSRCAAGGLVKKALARLHEAPVCTLLRVPVKHVSFLQKNHICSYRVPHVRLQSVRVKGDHGHIRRSLTRKPFGGVELAHQARVEHVSDELHQLH